MVTVRTIGYSLGFRPKLGSPIFIVGCGHSGTTLLLKILGTHSRLYSIPYESRMLIKGEVQDQQRTFDRLCYVHGKNRWVEKTPKHVLHLQDLFAQWPKAKVILMLRDGRDVAASLTQRGLSLAEGMQRWLADNAAGLPFHTHPNVLVVRYESLVRQFERTVINTLDFIGEYYEPQMAAFHTSTNPVFIKNHPDNSDYQHQCKRIQQMRQPLYDGSGIWKHLSASEISLLREMGMPMLESLGYAK